jgi:hypothetical protein
VVPPREALLLLPRLPDQASSTLPGRWVDALSALGVRMTAGDVEISQDGLLVVGRARHALGRGADLVLLDGRDRTRRLSRAGYRVQTYAAHRAGGGVVQLVPSGGDPLLAPLRIPAAEPVRRSMRERMVALVRRCTGRSYVTIAHRGSLTPAVVAAAGLRAPGATVLAGGGGARRRSTLVVPAAGGLAAAAVKVARASGRERGVHEQHVLQRLHGLADLRSAVPAPLGEGTLGLVCWSAETAVTGRPLTEALRRRGHVQGLAVLQDLAEWFTRLGEVTRTAGTTWDARRSTLALRAEHSGLADQRQHLGGVPGVLVHGDVGTGSNVLVGAAGLAIIDWETACEPELPLTDLLPMLCLALAAGREADDRADYVLRLCAGDEAESDWVLAAVRTYCRRVGVPIAQAGALGALAWGYQASMRLVHEELVTAAGEAPSRWVSPAEQVARSWASYPGLGADWPALVSGRPR